MNVLTAYYNIKHKVIFMKNLFYILIRDTQLIAN